jgi:hypothetical protein
VPGDRLLYQQKVASQARIPSWDSRGVADVWQMPASPTSGNGGTSKMLRPFGMEGLGAGARRSGNDGGSAGVPSLLSSLNAQWRVILAQDMQLTGPGPSDTSSILLPCPRGQGRTSDAAGPQLRDCSLRRRTARPRWSPRSRT